MAAQTASRSTRPTRKGGNRRPARPKMSAAEARTFDQTSERNYAAIQEAIETRAAEGIHEECACEPYASVFTVPRWNAQGYLVKKGEHAMRVATWVPARQKVGEQTPQEQSEGEQARVKLRPTTAFLFCACQVKPIPEG